MAAGACRRSGKEHIIRDNLTRHNYGNTNKNCKRLIYRDICGGGNFITQSAPTNFHQFYKRKILTASENISDFKEVTAAQKAQIEAADAKWEKPTDELITEWEAFGGVYNKATGFGELNGLTDLTANDMRTTNAFYARCAAPSNNWHSYSLSYSGGLFLAFQGRTLHKIHSNRLGGAGLTAQCLLENSKIEVVNFDTTSSNFISWVDAFSRCQNLHTIFGLTLFVKRPMDNAFFNCIALKNVYIKNAWDNLNFQWSPLITVDSLTYIIDNAKTKGQEDMTITLHPDAYARVTDELFALAAEKNITIATT